MGYSCTVKAKNTLDAIMNKKRLGNSQNTFRIAGRDGFYEIGKENPDGAITGSLYYCTFTENNDTSPCTGKASFRIEPDGKISRFPGLTKAEKWKYYQSAMAQYQQTFKIPFMAI